MSGNGWPIVKGPFWPRICTSVSRHLLCFQKVSRSIISTLCSSRGWDLGEDVGRLSVYLYWFSFIFYLGRGLRWRWWDARLSHLNWFQGCSFLFGVSRSRSLKFFQAEGLERMYRWKAVLALAGKYYCLLACLSLCLCENIEEGQGDERYRYQLPLKCVQLCPLEIFPTCLKHKSEPHQKLCPVKASGWILAC